MARGWGAASLRRRNGGHAKSRVFPAMTSALLLVVINFMMGAAAHTLRQVPRWLHVALAWATILTRHLLALHREYRAPGRQQPADRRGGVPPRGHRGLQRLG